MADEDVATMIDRELNQPDPAPEGARCAHENLRLHRTNRLLPATCTDCGAKLAVADLVARVLGPLEVNEAKIAALEERVAAVEKLTGLSA